jgi:hypothetical protein
MATSIKQYLENLQLDQTYVIYRISDGTTYLFNKHVSNDDKQVFCHVELANWYSSGVDIKVVPLTFVTTLENSLTPSIDEHELVSLEGNTDHNYFVQEISIDELEDERNSVLFMLEKFKSWKLKMEVVKMDMEPKFVNLVDKGIEFLETAALTGIGRKDEINIHEIAGLVQSSNNSLEVNAWDNSIEIEYIIPNACYFETFTIVFKVPLEPVKKSFPKYPDISSFKLKGIDRFKSHS